MELSDSSVRTLAGLSLAAASRLVGVSIITMRVYECGPHNVKNDTKRAACRIFYERLRELIAGVPFVRMAGEHSSPLISTNVSKVA